MDKPLETILVVDENPFLNIFHRRFLERLDIANKIVTFSTVEAASDFLKKNTTPVSNDKRKLLMLDVNLDIEHALQQLKFDEAQLKIMLVGDSPEDFTKIKSLRIKGFIDFVDKPLTTMKIKKLIRKHFTSKKSSKI